MPSRSQAPSAAPAGTPGGELARIEQELSRGRRASPLRRSIMEAMLAACGERGYREVTVARVIARHGGYRTQFYRQFSSKDDCYAAAYAWEMERLASRLLAAGGAEQSWRAGLRAALRELARYCHERPQIAAGVILEVRVASGESLLKRREIIGRLCRAIDRARHETCESRQSPPPQTARFMIGAVESVVCAALSEGRPARIDDALPGLARLIVTAYFGEEAGLEELAPEHWGPAGRDGDGSRRLAGAGPP